MKTETCKLYSRVFWVFLPNIIKIDPYNFELYRFKVGSFFETQRIWIREHADARYSLCVILTFCISVRLYIHCSLVIKLQTTRCWCASVCPFVSLLPAYVMHSRCIICNYPGGPMSHSPTPVKICIKMTPMILRCHKTLSQHMSTAAIFVVHHR